MPEALSSPAVRRSGVSVQSASYDNGVGVVIVSENDSPGRLQHLRKGRFLADLAGDTSGGARAFELGGFYAEYEAFLRALAAGRAPDPTLRDARQSVIVAEHIRRRSPEYDASRSS